MSVLGSERLQLADWRRCVAELYAEVRRTAASDPAAAHERWRTGREALYRGHQASPVPVERRAEFRAIHFPYDPGLRFELPLAVDPAPAPQSARHTIPIIRILLREDHFAAGVSPPATCP